MTVQDSKYMEAMRDAAKADNLTLSAEVRADFATLKTLIDTKPGIGWLIGTAIAIVGSMIAIFQFGGSQFSSGFAASSSFTSQVEQYKKDLSAQAEQTNKQISENSDRLENIEEMLVTVIDRQERGN